MTEIAAVVLVLSAINPIRRRYEIPPDRTRVAVGAGVAAAVLLVFGLVGESLLELLDITIPTFRVAAGLVLALVATVDLFRRLPGGGPVPEGWLSSLAPVAFPVLLRPEVVLVAVVVAADAGIAWLAAGAALAFADLVWWADRERNPRWERPLAMLISVLALVMAVDLLVDGVFAL